MTDTLYDVAWRAYRAAPRACANGPSRSAVRAAVDAVLANLIGNDATEQQPAWWRVTFRMYEDNADTCECFRRAMEAPNLDNIGIHPRPFEIVAYQALYTSPIHGLDLEQFRGVALAALNWADEYQLFRLEEDALRLIYLIDYLVSAKAET